MIILPYGNIKNILFYSIKNSKNIIITKNQNLERHSQAQRVFISSLFVTFRYRNKYTRTNDQYTNIQLFVACGKKQIFHHLSSYPLVSFFETSYPLKLTCLESRQSPKAKHR